MSQFSARAIDPAQTDALLEVVTQQITLLTFDDDDDEMLRRLVGCLADPRESAQMALARTFGEIGEGATGILIEGLLGHPIALARRGCGRALAKVQDPDAVPGLIQALLMDSDPRVKSAAASALVAIGEPAVRALLDVIASEVGMTETGHAAWALAHMDKEALPAFYRAIESPAGAVRCAVIAAMSAVLKAHDNEEKQKDEKAIAFIVEALTDLDPMVRTEAATAIGSIPLKVEIERLLVTLTDPVEAVRRAAAIALGRLGDRKAVQILEQVAVADESNSVRILARLAIGQIGGS